MKKVLALALVLALFMAGCSHGKPAEVFYHDIFQGSGPFLYEGETVLLEEFMAGEDPTAEIFYFTVMDLDGDGENEALAQIAASAGDAGGYLVLHKGKNGVAGFRLSARTMWSLKEDGTFVYSQAAGTEDGIASLSFAGDGCTLVKHAVASGEQFEFTEFTVDGQPVTEAEYNAAQDAHSRKADARWMEFNEEAIDTICD